MYCYDKKNSHKHAASKPIQLKKKINGKTKTVPDITTFTHDHTPHGEFPNAMVEGEIRNSIGWKLPFFWERYYKFQPKSNDFISFSVNNSEATVYHAGPFGNETTAQL